MIKDTHAHSFNNILLEPHILNNIVDIEYHGIGLTTNRPTVYNSSIYAYDIVTYADCNNYIKNNNKANLYSILQLTRLQHIEYKLYNKIKRTIRKS